MTAADCGLDFLSANTLALYLVQAVVSLYTLYMVSVVPMLKKKTPHKCVYQ